MYKVFLPKTKFNIYEKFEISQERILSFWKNFGLQKKRDEKRKNSLLKFILHDGPPYANGPLHMGHAENKFFKDALNKMFWQAGYQTPFICGWDAHGLPIENAVEKELKAKNIDKKSLSKQEFWDKCYNFAENWMNIQKTQFEKMGVFADFDNSYATFNEEESIGIIECVHDFVEKKLISQKYKPVLWSYVEKTALAYAEVEYKDKTSNSIYISFDIAKTDIKELENAKLTVWTTTPWTLPANMAVAYNDDFEYLIILFEDKKYVIEEKLANLFFQNYQIIKKIKGSELKNTTVFHPLKEFFKEERKLVHSSHVDNEKGTGFVHIAPAHGEDDFAVGLKNNLDIVDLFDEDGHFKSSVPLVFGKNFKEAEKTILEALKNSENLLKIEEIIHSYPHSWRSKAPLIYRLTKQWFVDMKTVKEKMLKASLDENLKWVPKEGKNRFISMLQLREDWCISRQRIWGVPIAIFYNKHTNEVVSDSEFLKKSRKKIEEVGVKNWNQIKISQIDSKYDDNDYIQVIDILDIWFESGATQHFVLKKKNLFPADVYLEGSDQHRGWFQSSMLISAVQNELSPWRALITHGFCLDDNKQKMSKSLGNVIDPMSWDIDELRIFFGTLNLTSDVSLNQNSINHAKEVLFRFKNTFKFLMGMLAIEDDIEEIKYENLPFFEKWILHRLSLIDAEFQNVLKEFQLNNYVNFIYEFCSQDLSSFYFDIRKDVLYCEDKNNFERKSAIYVFSIIMEALLKYIAPIAPYLCENVYSIYLEESNKEIKSIHLEDKFFVDSNFNNLEVFEKMEKYKELRKQVYQKIEILRESKEISTSYEVMVCLPTEFQDYDLIKTMLMVSCVKSSDKNELEVIKISDVWKKCPRCKFYFENIDEICQRCSKVLKEC